MITHVCGVGGPDKLTALVALGHLLTIYLSLGDFRKKPPYCRRPPFLVVWILVFREDQGLIDVDLRSAGCSRTCRGCALASGLPVSVLTTNETLSVKDKGRKSGYTTTSRKQ